MADDVKSLFVYGSLMVGQPNHRHYRADALTMEPAVTIGRLYHLPMGYRAMIDVPDGRVFGEAMTFPDLAAASAAASLGERMQPPARPRQRGSVVLCLLTGVT